MPRGSESAPSTPTKEKNHYLYESLSNPIMYPHKDYSYLGIIEVTNEEQSSEGASSSTEGHATPPRPRYYSPKYFHRYDVTQEQPPGADNGFTRVIQVFKKQNTQSHSQWILKLAVPQCVRLETFQLVYNSEFDKYLGEERKKMKLAPNASLSEMSNDTLADIKVKAKATADEAYDYPDLFHHQLIQAVDTVKNTPEFERQNKKIIQNVLKEVVSHAVMSIYNPLTPKARMVVRKNGLVYHASKMIPPNQFRGLPKGNDGKTGLRARCDFYQELIDGEVDGFGHLIAGLLTVWENDSHEGNFCYVMVNGRKKIVSFDGDHRYGVDDPDTYQGRFDGYVSEITLDNLPVLKEIERGVYEYDVHNWFYQVSRGAKRYPGYLRQMFELVSHRKFRDELHRSLLEICLTPDDVLTNIVDHFVGFHSGEFRNQMLAMLLERKRMMRNAALQSQKFPEYLEDKATKNRNRIGRFAKHLSELKGMKGERLCQSSVDNLKEAMKKEYHLLRLWNDIENIPALKQLEASDRSLVILFAPDVLLQQLSTKELLYEDLKALQTLIADGFSINRLLIAKLYRFFDRNDGKPYDASSPGGLFYPFEAMLKKAGWSSEALQTCRRDFVRKMDGYLSQTSHCVLRRVNVENMQSTLGPDVGKRLFNVLENENNPCNRQIIARKYAMELAYNGDTGALFQELSAELGLRIPGVNVQPTQVHEPPVPS